MKKNTRAARFSAAFSSAYPCFVGAVLIAAAIMKLLASTSLSEFKLPIPPAVAFAAVELELIIGLWLIIGHFAAWLKMLQ